MRFEDTCSELGQYSISKCFPVVGVSCLDRLDVQAHAGQSVGVLVSGRGPKMFKVQRYQR